MAYNPIQFQQGMSLPEFLQCFGTEATCAEALRRSRWPDGFVCPGCSCRAHCRVVGNGRSLYQCHACHRQTSLTAGTLLDNTKLPLTRWFLAIYLISQAKTGLSALALKRHIGVSYPTAWLMHHKIMTADGQPGCTVLSDGLACCAAVTNAGCTHRTEAVGQRKPRDLPQFKWVNNVLGNLKTMMSGAYMVFGCAKYAQRYLGAFAYRFNQRFDLVGLVVNLIVDLCRAKAVNERSIRHA